jgi:hypothetical protein
VKLRGSTATVDTGRTVTCPAGADACRLRVTARVSHRSAVAGTALVRLGAGKSAKVTMRLTGKTTRLLRQRKRLTLAVKAVLDRGRSLHATSSFAVTVKAPKRR